MQPDTLVQLSAGSYRKLQSLHPHIVPGYTASDPEFQISQGDHRKSPADHVKFLHMLFCLVHTAVGRHLWGGQ